MVSHGLVDCFRELIDDHKNICNPVSPHQVDAQLVQLLRDRAPNGIITLDSNTLVYGTKFLVKEWSYNSKRVEISSLTKLTSQRQMGMFT